MSPISELYVSHYKPLCAFIRKRMGASDDVADIAQQAFCEALCSYRNFSGRATLQTWLYGIALNLMYKHLSRARRVEYQNPGDWDVDMEIEDAEQASADDTLNAREQLRRVSALLDQSSDSNRQALLMVAVDGMSYSQAAQALQVATGTVRSRVSRLRSDLREELGLTQAPVPLRGTVAPSKRHHGFTPES